MQDVTQLKVKQDGEIQRSTMEQSKDGWRMSGDAVMVERYGLNLCSGSHLSIYNL